MHPMWRLVNAARMQGLVLNCSPLEWQPLDAFAGVSGLPGGSLPPVWLALDEVTDPVRPVLYPVHDKVCHT